MTLLGLWTFLIFVGLLGAFTNMNGGNFFGTGYIGILVWALVIVVVSVTLALPLTGP